MLEMPLNQRFQKHIENPRFRFWEEKLFLGSYSLFLGTFLGKYNYQNRKDDSMVKRNYKGRCTKKSVSKSKDVCRAYSDIQLGYLDVLQANEEIVEIQCNVPLEGDEAENYTTDFLCVKASGDMMVRECIYRKLLLKPMTVKQLDISLQYWRNHGIQDWGLVIDAEK